MRCHVAAMNASFPHVRTPKIGSGRTSEGRRAPKAWRSFDRGTGSEEVVVPPAKEQVDLRVMQSEVAESVLADHAD
jgi:hypothetical protein